MSIPLHAVDRLAIPMLESTLGLVTETGPTSSEVSNNAQRANVWACDEGKVSGGAYERLTWLHAVRPRSVSTSFPLGG